MPLIPEEQEGQFRTDEQAVPSTEYARDEKQFDAAHPPVVQPLNPTPALSNPKVMEHQVSQVKTSEQDKPGSDVHDANPTDI